MCASERVERLLCEQYPISLGGQFARLRATGVPIVLSTMPPDVRVIPGTEPGKPRVMVALIATDKVIRSIDLEDLAKENAYGEAEVRLLSTVESSVGVALESALLVEETQRLLQETEQRAGELAVINSIQQGIAAELEFQAIIDLVGDKLREVLAFGDVQIVLWNAATGTAHVLYAVERGMRIQVPPRRPNVDGPMFKALQSNR